MFFNRITYSFRYLESISIEPVEGLPMYHVEHELDHYVVNGGKMLKDNIYLIRRKHHSNPKDF